MTEQSGERSVEAGGQVDDKNAYEDHVKWLRDNNFSLWACNNGVETFICGPIVVKLMKLTPTVHVRLADTEVSGDSPLDAIRKSRWIVERMRNTWEKIDDAIFGMLQGYDNG